MFLIDQRNIEKLIDTKIQENIEKLYFKDISVGKLNDYKHQLEDITRQKLNDVSDNFESKLIQNFGEKINMTTRVVVGINVLNLAFTVYNIYKMFKLSSR